MPARDRTGPRGQGSRTGWGMGHCRGREDRTSGPGGRGFGMGRGRGRGMGPGRGRGRAWGGGGVDAGAADDDLEGLRAESSRLKRELDAVEGRLSKFEERD